ncbi:hypothetical protein [Paenibacillus xylaniclasticus]|uniref:hypothetical protein n=1 Tax=Paenibacillus xylaniclasticus TaxID=588083 RepID=UPI001C3F7DE1|nr:hypothetical protein [Paenibacillus xylaniclasticus]
MNTYNEVVRIANEALLPLISEIYELEGYEIKQIPPHGGRNLAYNCDKEGAGAKIIRIAFLHDRNREDFLAEVEYIRYLFEHGGSVSNVVSSKNGNLVEEIVLHYIMFCMQIHTHAIPSLVIIQ